MDVQQFADAVLQGIGAPITPQGEQTIEAWAAKEGGAGPQFGIANNTDNFNPLDTSLSEPGSNPTNADGIQSYTSWAQGVQATVSTLLNTGGGTAYASIVSDLKGGASEQQTAADIGASQWGTPDFDPGGTASPVSGTTGSGSSSTGTTQATDAGIVSDILSPLLGILETSGALILGIVAIIIGLIVIAHGVGSGGGDDGESSSAPSADTMPTKKGKEAVAGHAAGEAEDAAELAG